MINIDKQKLRKILLTSSIVAIALITCSALFLISHTLSTKNVSITPEMVEAAYAKLIRMYGEINFQPDKMILQLLQKELNTYQDSNFFKNGLANKHRFQEMILSTLQANGLSDDYIYLAFVESFYNPAAENKRTGALGMWQLLPETARSFGLRVNETVDERLDPEKSTVAAARYLKHLQDNFGKGEFTLIIAAYKAGEAAVSAGLRQLDNSGVNSGFWKLYKKNLVPGSTRAFVIRLITFLILGEELLPRDVPEPETPLPAPGVIP